MRIQRVSVVYLLTLLASVAVAAEREGTHFVRPGETLRGITREYLGTESRWQENWRLNPDLENPDVLEPGQRIRILVPDTESQVPTARVVLVAGQVEGRPAPVDWLAALQDDLLRERDGLRTRASSSTALQFSDGTQLALTEDSLIFLRRTGRSLEGVGEREIEILQGQAELASVGGGAPAADIEIVIGNTRAKPQTGAGGELQARARVSETGGAAVMMYEGSGEVEASGEKVEVERGMGTAVPESGPPAPPEKLLPAPEILAPVSGSQLPYPDPEFSWTEVDGAVSYVLELCLDAGCGELYRRFSGLVETTWQADPLPVRQHYWRVTAVSPSGLDGYPSDPRPLTVLTDQRDEAAPVAQFTLEGPSVENRGTIFYDATAQVGVEVTDEPTGVAEWEPRIDGRAVAESALAGPWSDGDHAVDVWAIDRAGNEAVREGSRFIVDAEPPHATFELADESALADLVAGDRRPERWKRRWDWWLRRNTRALSRPKADPALWALVAWTPDSLAGLGEGWSYKALRWHERRKHGTLTHAGEAPGVLIAAPRLELPSGELLGERMLLVRVEDERAGGRSLTVRSIGGDDGAVLEITTVDRLGNEKTGRLSFVPASK